MDTTITKKRISNHFEYDWFKYLLFIMAAVFLWLFIYSVIDPVHEHQKLDFFCAVPFSESETKEFAEDFTAFLKNGGDETITETNFMLHSYSPNDAYTFSMLLNTSYRTYDLFIAEEAAMRYLVTSGNVVSFDNSYTDYFAYNDMTVSGSVWQGFQVTKEGKTTDIAPYFEQDFFDAYYVFDEEQKQKLITEQGELDAEYAENLDNNVLNHTYGIELNAIGENLLINYGYKLDDEGNATGEKLKYYIGVILPNLSSKNGGGNKGIFNGKKQSINNAQAWEALVYLKENYQKYII